MEFLESRILDTVAVQHAISMTRFCAQEPTTLTNLKAFE